MEYEYKQIERATLEELDKVKSFRAVGTTKGHHKRLRIGDASILNDTRMNFPIFEVLDCDGEIIGLYIHTSKIDILDDDEIDCDEF